MAPTKNESSGNVYREQLTAELQSRSVQLFVTLASIGDAVITTDNTGGITFLNPMAETLTGWSFEEAVGLDIGRVFTVIDSKNGNVLSSTVLESIKTASKMLLPPDAVLFTRDGRKIPIDDSAAPIVDSEKNILGAVLVFRDVTEKKKSEQMMKFRSELDRIAAQISTAFITSPVTNVDNEIDVALQKIGAFLDAERAYVVLFSNYGATLTYSYDWYQEGVEPLKHRSLQSSSISYWTDKIFRREYIYTSSLEEIPEEAHNERTLWVERKMHTLVAVPIMQEDRVLGFIGLESLKKTKPWPEEIIDMLYLIGNVFASAMARRDAQEKLERAREKEVEIGSRIQQALLISEPPYSFADYQVAALTIPSRKIDGDFYDFLSHPNHCLDIIFGDVMGKGVPAALLAAGSKTEFLRSMSHLLTSSRRGVIPSPQNIVNNVHSILTPQLMALDSFVTLTYARFDPDVQKITLVDCGNTRILRCHADSGAIEHLAGFNVPLGFATSEVYAQAEFDYNMGDVFVLYSDGATEARGENGEMFGIQRLSELIVEKRHLTPHQMLAAIKKRLREFVGESILTDDFTCVVVKIISEISISTRPSSDEMEISSSLTELATVRDFLRGFCELRGECGLNEHETHLLELAATEVASNIIKHAYKGIEEQPIWIRIELARESLKVKFSHNGDPFEHPEQIPLPSIDSAKEGGFGLFIINRSVDDINYGTDSEGKQYIELIKRVYNTGGSDYAI